jgi:N-acyl-D-amino-acid deacylase
MRILFIALLALALRAQEFDLVIRNGRIADGTGNPTFVADLGIRAGRITA